MANAAGVGFAPTISLFLPQVSQIRRAQEARIAIFSVNAGRLG